MSEKAHDEMSPLAAAAYGAFLWQLMKVRPALQTLAKEAFSAKDRDATSPAKDSNPNRMIYALLASMGRNMQNEISQSVRNNCAGASLQIAWTLFDSHLEMLGVAYSERRNVRAGEVIADSEPFSRVLWAARNAFAHGYEWAAAGPRTPAGQESVRILQAIGFSGPSNLEAYDFFALLSNGDVETFIQRLQEAAREIAAAQPPAVVADPKSWEPAVSGIVSLLVLGAIFLVYFSSKASATTDQEGILLFQMGTGTDAKVVPFARGKIGSPAQIQSAIEQAAIRGLSSSSARPFREVEDEFTAWMASAEVLIKTDVGSERFYLDLVSACETMDRIYEKTVNLPNPVTVLLEERGCNTIEDAQAVLASLLEGYEDFEAEPFRVINKDIVSTIGNDAEPPELQP